MMFELFSDAEKEMMMRYISEYSGHDGDYNHPSASLEYLLRFWNESKEKLFHMFGDKFILSKEVSYHIGEDELAERIGNILSYGGAGYRFYTSYHDAFGFYDWEIRHRVICLLDSYTLAENVYEGETFTITNDNTGKSVVVNSGCKVSKMLGKIAAAFDIEGYEEFRLAHSQALNQKLLKGTLCLSIHPMDFMTMSDNDCGWVSCMNWPEPGCYRRGTVEMMNSPMVVCAYLRAADDMRVPGGYSWANKKWRELCIVTPDLITNVLGYPYRNEVLSTMCVDWLRELNTEVIYTQKPVKMNTYEWTIIPELDKSIRLEPYTNAMYNDFGEGHMTYFGTHLADREYKEITLHFNYSGRSICLDCGRETSNFDTEGNLICMDCSPTYRCTECGNALYDECDGYYVDGEILCESCFCEYAAEDFVTLESHFKDNMTPIYFGTDIKNVDSCSRVWSKEIFTRYNYESSLTNDAKEFFNKIYHFTIKEPWNCFREYYVVLEEDCTNEGLKVWESRGSTLSLDLDGFEVEVIQ